MLAFPVIVYSRIVTAYNVIQGLTLLAILSRFVLWSARGNRRGWVMGGVFSNENTLYLVSTFLVLGTMLLVFNLLVLRVSLSLIQTQERLTPLSTEMLIDTFALTDREVEIVSLVAAGKSNKEIGGDLYITEGTVNSSRPDLRLC